MSQADVEVVRDWFSRYPPDQAEAYRDPEFVARAGPALEQLLHPDFVFHAGEADFTGLQGSYEGVDGFIAFLREWYSVWARYRQEPEEFIDVGDGRVLVLGRERGRSLSSDAEVAAEVGSVYHVRDGRIARIDAYQHWENARRAAGLD